MDLHEFFDYKNRLMKELCTNEDIVKMVTGNPEAKVPNHDLPYTQIFPYEFIPETVAEGKTFICFDVDIGYVPSKTVYFPIMYIYIFTHKSRMRTEDGHLLLDELASKVDDLLNGSRMFGYGELDLSSAERFIPITDFRGRVLTYRAADFNRAGKKMTVPSNRKRGV